jgi:chemotaxis protein methyltransferase CheR
MIQQFDLRHVCFEGKPVAGSRRALQGQSTQVVLSHVHLSKIDEDAQSSDNDFLHWVLCRAGLGAAIYHSSALARRLPACLRALKAGSTNVAQNILENRPDLLPAAITSLLIGVTEFLRDKEVFESVRAEVLPRLAAEHRPLRVWSAGSSTGEELYSLAILFAEADVLELTYFLGTDCRTDAIERARQSLYGLEAIQSWEPAIRGKYFEPAGEAWRPIGPLRRRMHWKIGDLAEKTEEGPWDVILCRNLAIYLNPAAAEQIWTRLTGALRPGGFLIVGKAERLPAYMDLAPLCRCIYRAGDSTEEKTSTR